jgi:endonuclease VIII
MPEGDTIHKLAAAMRPDLLGRVLQEVRLASGVAGAERLVGQEVSEVWAVGKHLLIQVRGGWLLRSWLGMTGKWHRYRLGERWQKEQHLARAVLHTERHVFVCFQPPQVEVFHIRELPGHPRLSRLGPDLCLPDPDLDEVLRRARLGSDDRPIGDLLLDQQVAAGIGNVFRCELLFLERLDPWRPACEVPDEALRSVYVRAAELLRANLLTARRTTLPATLRAPPGRRDRTPGALFWVYDRLRRPCRRCGAMIQQTRTGENARLLWWCPDCQG